MCSMLYAADIVDLADVGMIQRGDSSGFTLEPLAELRAGNFDRDVPIQTRVLGAIHFCHAARANKRKDFVRAKLIAERKQPMTDQTKFSPSESG
jgi:hypothetical protein